MLTINEAAVNAPVLVAFNVDWPVTSIELNEPAFAERFPLKVNKAPDIFAKPALAAIIFPKVVEPDTVNDPACMVDVVISAELLMLATVKACKVDCPETDSALSNSADD